MSKKSTSDIFEDVPYRANDAKATEVYWSKAIPHRGIAEFRRLRGQRGAQKAPTKKLVSVRFDLDVLETFRASGPGWQTRINAALADWLKTHSPEELRACWRSAFIPQPSPAPRAPPTSSLSIRTAHCAALPSSSSDLDLTPHGSAHTGPSAPHRSLYSPSTCQKTGSWHARLGFALPGRSTCTAEWRSDCATFHCAVSFRGWTIRSVTFRERLRLLTSPAPSRLVMASPKISCSSSSTGIHKSHAISFFVTPSCRSAANTFCNT